MNYEIISITDRIIDGQVWVNLMVKIECDMISSNSLSIDFPMNEKVSKELIEQQINSKILFIKSVETIKQSKIQEVSKLRSEFIGVKHSMNLQMPKIHNVVQSPQFGIKRK
jgi:hypothetical protein